VPDRDQIIEKLKDKNIETQIGTYSLHMHKAFSENSNCTINGEMPGSRYAFEHCLTLPLYQESMAKFGAIIPCLNTESGMTLITL